MTAADPELVAREAVRGVLLTPDARILLVQVENPGNRRRFWITPGGGIEPGESHHEALVRELREETGFALTTPGPRVWIRRHEHEWNGRRVDYTEHFYLIETETFEPTDAGNPEPAEVAAQQGFRWWLAAEILAGDGEVIFAPRRLGSLLDALVTDGPPELPLRVGA